MSGAALFNARISFSFRVSTCQTTKKQAVAFPYEMQDMQALMRTSMQHHATRVRQGLVAYCNYPSATRMAPNNSVTQRATRSVDQLQRLENLVVQVGNPATTSEPECTDTMLQILSALVDS
jgi:hypothetical protein